MKPSSCEGCLGYCWPGPISGEGTGENGVLIVAEAPGEQEAKEGLPFRGRAGLSFTQMLQRGRMKRSEFRINNTILCRPPNNKLSGAPYEDEVIASCAHFLNEEIAKYKPRCIVACGYVPFRRLLPDVQGSISKNRGYVFWSEAYQCWVIPTFHPSYIMRGKSGLSSVFIHDLQRATEIATSGHQYDDHSHFLLDPTPIAAESWVEQFEGAHPEWLSVDIETPDKDESEEELELEDEEQGDWTNPSATIFRCGYSYNGGEHVMSLPWSGMYAPIHKQLLANAAPKLFHNVKFDVPRLHAAGCDVEGVLHDSMVAWHVLNSDLPKALGFVATFTCPGQAKWKHLSGEEPAYYNAVDAAVADKSMQVIVRELRRVNLWRVYERHVLMLGEVTAAMSKAGMPLDHGKRYQFAMKLTEMSKAVRDKMQEVVPGHIRKLSPEKGYVREPKDVKGLTLVTIDGVSKKYCPGCQMEDPPKQHFKVYKKKQNPCGGLEVAIRVDGAKRWAKVLPFVPSPKQILDYQTAVGHQPIKSHAKNQDASKPKFTTDDKAIRQLLAKYREDPLYPLVLEDRELSKLGGTYIGYIDDRGKLYGGMPVGRDGRVHTVFTNNPSTLRMSSASPNLQNLPRVPKTDDALAAMVRGMFVAGPGNVLWGCDYTGIEAVLVGYFANSQRYTRLAKIGVHDYFTAHMLYNMGRISAADLPDLKWSDGDLKEYAKKVIKAKYKDERDVGKRCVHLSNYKGTPARMHLEYPESFPTTKDASAIQRMYFDLFPEIPKWHETICKQVDKTTWVRNPFGYIHRFYNVIKWEKGPGGWDWSYGDDAKRLIAFGPQSTAAAIIKEAGIRVYFGHPDVAPDLRLFVHDEILGESKKGRLEYVLGVVIEEMGKPIPELPLDPAWGMGNHLSIGVESKHAVCWADM